MFPSMMVSVMMVVRCGPTSSSSRNNNAGKRQNGAGVVLPPRMPKGRRILLVKTKPRQQQRVQFSKSFFDSLSGGGGVFGAKTPPPPPSKRTTTTKERDETFSLKKTSTDHEDDDEYTVIDPLSPSFLGSFPNEWQNSNEKLRLVLNAFEGCSRTAMLSLGPIQACVSAQALLVFVSEQKKQNRLENFLNDFWQGKVALATERVKGKMSVDRALLERHFDRERTEYEGKLANMRGENAAVKSRAEMTRREMFETKGLVRKMQEDIEEFKCLVEIQKEEMEQFKKNEYALKCKTEQQFDSMYQTFTKDFVLLRHAKKQQAKAHTFEIERRDRAEKVLKAKTAQQFDKMYETLVRDIAMKDHEIAQLQTQLSAYEDDLKEKEKMIEGMEVKLRMANEEKSRIERALISANHHHQTEIQELNVIITGLLDSIQTLEREAAEEEVRKERIWSEKTAEIESLKQKVMDLRIDHSVVEHRMELARQQLEKEYEEKKTEVSVEADTRIVNTIERVARAQFERLHDMTVLKNKFVRDHENEMEALKASVEIKEREIVENSKKAEEKIEAIARELAEAKDSYARELNVVSDLSSSRAIEIEKLKTEISDANEKEREIVEELKTVQSALFEEKAKVARVEQGSSETLKQAEWDFFSENAKLKQVEHELELKLEHANLEKHQIERALYSSAAHENELQEKVKSMKNSIAKAAKEVEYTEAKLEQSNLEKFQIQRALITRTKNEEELREEVVNMKNSVEQWAKAVQLSEEKLEQSNLEKFQIERALITRTKNEEELSKNVQDLTARQVSFETQFRAARRAAKAERNALYALARNENAKAHKQNFVTDTKDIESERYAQYAQMRDDLEGMQRKVKLAQTACEAERRAREVAETERDSALLELSASNARLVEEQQNVGKEEASSSSSTSGESRESRMEALVRENEELIERVKLLEIVALDAREQEALAVNRLEAIELKARERRNRVSSAIDSHGEIEKENRDSNSGARRTSH